MGRRFLADRAAALCRQRALLRVRRLGLVRVLRQPDAVDDGAPRGGEDEGESSEAARTWAALWGETTTSPPPKPGSGRGGRRRSTRAGTGTGPPEAATAGRRRSARIAARPTSRAAAAPESLFDGNGTSPGNIPGNIPGNDGRFRAHQPPRVATRSTCRTTSAAAAWLSRGDTPRRSARPPRPGPSSTSTATRRKRRTRRTGIRTATRRRTSRTWSSAWGRGKANTLNTSTTRTSATITAATALSARPRSPAPSKFNDNNGHASTNTVSRTDSPRWNTT